MQSTGESTKSRSGLRLFLLSFLMLFLELALIRWLGSNIVFLSYFSNFVLLGSFLGIGLGFLRAGRGRSFVPFAPFALCGLVLFVALLPVEVDRGSTQLIFFGTGSSHDVLTGLPIWFTLPVIFFAVAFVMMTIGEAVAEAFARFPPLDAYRLDIAGSLVGIVSFVALSFAGAPPVVWGVIVVLLLAALVVLPPARAMGSSRQRLVAAGQLAALAVIAVVLLGESTQPRTEWSPYYKLTWAKLDWGKGSPIDVSANGVPHQQIESTEKRLKREPFYFYPYTARSTKPLDRVLIVGAGNGTDVAIALREGARHVDAVEIDPGLQRLGQRFQPDRPWADPRVERHINDGRAFLEHTTRRYDLILFALPDSLTLVSGQSSLRLESYLFTQEAMLSARKHLRPGGTFSMYNYYRERWLVDRLAGTLASVYGHPPCLWATKSVLAVMAISDEPSSMRCDSLWKAKGAVPAPARDNYPFLYLKDRAIPNLYLASLGLILVFSLLAIERSAGSLKALRPHGDLFLMGAAFLLLETKNVVQFALLFGTTWLVNALVFAAILVSVLLAIEVARRWRPKRPAALYVALLAALVVAFLVPSSALLQLSFWPRFAVAGALAFAPIFLANLIFAERFRDSSDSAFAFGANLLGAMAGGVLEYLALLVGYKLLLVVVAVLYCLAFITGRRHLFGMGDAPPDLLKDSPGFKPPGDGDGDGGGDGDGPGGGTTRRPGATVAAQ